MALVGSPSCTARVAERVVERLRGGEGSHAWCWEARPVHPCLGIAPPQVGGQLRAANADTEDWDIVAADTKRRQGSCCLGEPDAPQPAAMLPRRPNGRGRYAFAPPQVGSTLRVTWAHSSISRARDRSGAGDSHPCWTAGCRGRFRLQLRRRLVPHQAGFDERYAPLSPGRLLRAEALRTAIEDGSRSDDSLGQMTGASLDSNTRPRTVANAYRVCDPSCSIR
jgi:hypothetical protein